MSNLAPEIEQGLSEFMEAARQAFGEALVSAVLFGSAAEGRVRAVSDVNLLLILKCFDKREADLIREPFRAAHAAIRLEVMFLLQDEIDAVMDAFALKFSDIRTRRRVIYGPDPFLDMIIPPETLRRRTIQVLLNLMLRLRERYTLVSLREEQLPRVAAEVAGPLRACAASVLSLEGREASSPHEALATILAEQDPARGKEVTDLVDAARREGALPPGTAGPLLFSLMAVAQFMHDRIAPSRGGGDHHD